MGDLDRKLDLSGVETGALLAPGLDLRPRNRSLPDEIEFRGGGTLLSCSETEFRDAGTVFRSAKSRSTTLEVCFREARERLSKARTLTLRPQRQGTSAGVCPGSRACARFAEKALAKPDAAVAPPIPYAHFEWKRNRIIDRNQKCARGRGRRQQHQHQGRSGFQPGKMLIQPLTLPCAVISAASRARVSAT